MQNREAGSQQIKLPDGQRTAPSRFEITVRSSEKDDSRTEGGVDHSIELGEPSHDQIAKRAYELFQQRGCTPGRCEKNWLDAEHAILVGRLKAASASARQDDLTFHGQKMGNAVFMAAANLPVLSMGGGVDLDRDKTQTPNGSSSRKA
jgi:hypothetical protein